MELRLLAAAAAAALSLASPAGASTVFTATLTTSQEPGLINPTLDDGITPRAEAFGSGAFVLNDAGSELSMTITVYNIDITGLQTTDVSDNLTAAHIHAGNTATPTFPVRWGFFGAPLNDNNPMDLVVTPFASGVGGTFTTVWNAPEGQLTTLADQIPNILAGNAYVNFHTVQFAGGEIRGAITQAVPEPATWAMMIMGFAAAGSALRRRPSRWLRRA